MVSPRDKGTVAYLAYILAGSARVLGGKIKKPRLKLFDLDKRLITIVQAETPKGNGTVELNRTDLAATAKFWARAQKPGAREPGHYPLPANLT